MRHFLILGIFSLLASNVFAETHTYENPGTYNASVKVCDQYNLCTTKSVVINVRGNSAPIVTLVATPVSGLAPLSVTLTATATDPDNDTMTYTWNFGDVLPPPTN